jgi:hypothetical protein
MSFRLYQAMRTRLQGSEPAKLSTPFKTTCIKAGHLLLWGGWITLFTVQGAYLHIVWQSHHPEAPPAEVTHRDVDYTLSSVHYLFKTQPLPEARERDAVADADFPDLPDDQAEAADLDEEGEAPLIDEASDSTTSKDEAIDPVLKARVQQALAEIDEGSAT